MNFTFGIVTDGNSKDRIYRIIDSIEIAMSDDYEIIIIGGKNDDIKGRKNTRTIEFIDDQVSGKISEKKNIITRESKYENIVYLHDYIEFTKEWHTAFKVFGDNFDVCMNSILNTDMTRYRDWCLWMDDAKGYVENNNYLIPYDLKNLSKMMYISGAYWVAKKKFMLENMLNEKLKWGQGEDVEWSIRVRKITNFSINEGSVVKLMKYKDRIFNEPTDIEISKLRNILNYNNTDDYENLVKNHISKWIN
jgi:hypothetical protein